MAETIFRTEPTPFLAEWPAWHVERQPGMVTDPWVVHFRKQGKVRTLLDQSARWTPTGWDPKRWVPRSPTVPKWLIERVEAHMLQVEVA